jgi:uncharacterized protein YpiB (UPF0302 family)
VAKHLGWPLGKVQVAIHYAEAFPEEVDEALTENDTTNFDSLKRILPQAAEFTSGKAGRR